MRLSPPGPEAVITRERETWHRVPTMSSPSVLPSPVGGCVCPDLHEGETCATPVGQRCVSRLPKAHLHLHLTGGMRHTTLLDLAAVRRIVLPDRLTSSRPLHLDVEADRRGWFAFQHLYDAARNVVDSQAVLSRLMREMCEDEAAEGSGWVELQVDPSGYSARFGGVHAVLDGVLSAAADASESTGVGVGVIVASSRVRHPLSASTLARLAAQYAPGSRWGRAEAGRGAVDVVGFGLSNDERVGRTAEFAQAFRIARSAGLAGVPHAGELVGAESVRSAVVDLEAARVGHGVRAIEDPSVVALMAERGVAAEVCPVSNVALGVATHLDRVPVPALTAAGVRVALSADDPLLFGSRLAAQYRAMRSHHRIDDAGLADLARDSVDASLAPEIRKASLLTGIGAWLTSE